MFVERYGLWSDEQKASARDVLRKVEADELGVVRVCFADQHGILRGKTIVASELNSVFTTGCACSSTLLLKDTSHQTIVPVFGEKDPLGLAAFQGAGDVILVPDPSTFRVLPWAPHSGWILCDLYLPSGEPLSLSSRGIMRRALDQLEENNLEFVSGLELEFHLFSLGTDAPMASAPGRPAQAPKVELVNAGYQYLTELRYDALDPLFEKLRTNLQALGLPVRTFEIEFGPSQVEVTLSATAGMQSADNLMLFRSAVKQICRREGYLASFMCRPAFPGAMSSGWHLHQSLRDSKTGNNLFAPTKAGELTEVADHYLAGLLRHAMGATIFAAPTINGYRRFRPNSLAPDRVNWCQDNRGAMIRAIMQTGDPASRLENRVGEPAANPYLYMASQIFSGLSGIAQSASPPPPTTTPYDAGAQLLPRSLAAAVEALRADNWLIEQFGHEFVSTYLAIKEAEIERHRQDVSDWEQREYLELF